MRIDRISAGSSASIDLLNEMFYKKKSSSSSYVYADTSGEAVKSIQNALASQQAVASEISDYTKLKRTFSKLTDDQKTELSSVLSKAAAQIKKGTLDSEALSDGASKSLKAALKSNGVDLASSLDSLNSLYKQTKAKIFDSNGALR